MGKFRFLILSLFVGGGTLRGTKKKYRSIVPIWESFNCDQPIKLDMYADILRASETAKRLFRHNEVVVCITQELKHSNLNLALILFFLAALLSSIVMILAAGELTYLSAYMQDNLQVSVEDPVIDYSVLVPIILFQILFAVPFTLIFSLIYEGSLYHALKLTGGKGTFTQHYYIASVVALPTAASSLMYLFVPLPCIALLAFLTWIGLSIYLLFFVGIRAYQLVHDISYLHAFLITLIIFVPSRLLVMFVTANAAVFFGIPNVIPYT